MGDYVVEVAFQCCRSQGRAFRGDEAFGKLAIVSGSHGEESRASTYEVIVSIVPSERLSQGPTCQYG